VTFERVYTMTDWYDGPRSGVANFEGKPHEYSCPFDHWLPGLGDLYELRPIDAATFRLVLEDWEIYVRWEAARAAGEVPAEPHGVLPADRERSAVIDELLASRLVAFVPPAEGVAALAALPPPIRVRGVFRSHARIAHLDARDMEVEWTREPVSGIRPVD
jgi:hypothetical protein